MYTIIDSVYSQTLSTYVLRNDLSVLLSFNGNTMDWSINGNRGLSYGPIGTIDRLGISSYALYFNKWNQFTYVQDTSILPLTRDTRYCWIEFSRGNKAFDKMKK